MIHELVYPEDKEGKRDIISLLPDSSVVKDASDFIHTHRFEIEVDMEEDEFYPYAIKAGFALCLFGFNAAIYDRPDVVGKWIDIADNLVLNKGDG